MKFSKASGTLGLLALAGLSGNVTAAEDAGWYIGGNIGHSRATIDDEKISRTLQGNGFNSVYISDDDHDAGFKLFGAYQFNPYFSLEGGYFDLGEFGYTASVLPAGMLTGNVELKGLNLDAVGMLPLTKKWSALARIGVNYAKADSGYSGNGAVIVTTPGAREKAANYKLGIGLQYAMTRALGLRAEAERYRVDDSSDNKGDVDLFSLGMIYRFGGKSESVAVATEKEAAPEKSQEATPIPVVVPMAKGTQRYCSILDIQFEIDKDGIEREQKEKLAVVGTFMNKYPDTTAVIEGHSDNVGGKEHNTELSLHRAESVVDYLKETSHIDGSRLKAEGYGDTRPVADNHTEEGKRLNRRIDAVIACASDIEGLKVAPARLTMAMEMEFDKNKADIRPEYHDDLGKVAKFMKANPGITATVEGHTGNLQATPALAMEISQRRAQNVVDELVDSFGVPRSRLSAQGFGQTRRFAYSTTAEGQQDNRRVNIIFNYKK
jgi:OmpA-OmpF porin, OOP family